MTKKRFLEKKIQNYDLSRWDIYHEIAYPLINNKEAVLFVVLSDNVPISICLNFVRDNTIYGYLRAYDIDLINIEGKVVQHLEGLPPYNLNNPNGVYYLRLKTENILSIKSVIIAQ